MKDGSAMEGERLEQGGQAALREPRESTRTDDEPMKIRADVNEECRRLRYW